MNTESSAAVRIVDVIGTTARSQSPYMLSSRSIPLLRSRRRPSSITATAPPSADSATTVMARKWSSSLLRSVSSCLFLMSREPTVYDGGRRCSKRHAIASTSRRSRHVYRVTEALGCHFAAPWYESPTYPQPDCCARTPVPPESPLVDPLASAPFLLPPMFAPATYMAARRMHQMASIAQSWWGGGNGPIETRNRTAAGEHTAKQQQDRPPNTPHWQHQTRSPTPS